MLTCPAAVIELSSGLVHTFEGVRAEEIPLGLKKISGQRLRAEAVKILQTGRESRNGNTGSDSQTNHSSPGELTFDNLIGEVLIQEQVIQGLFL